MPGRQRNSIWVLMLENGPLVLEWPKQIDHIFRRCDYRWPCVGWPMNNVGWLSRLTGCATSKFWQNYTGVRLEVANVARGRYIHFMGWTGFV